MKRRDFIRHTSLGAVWLQLPVVDRRTAPKSHVISLSFDDGFRKSFLRAAEIHENYGTKGCFNVIASGHLRSFKAIDQWILPELMGDFDDWNNLQSRGHEVMPHTWAHLNLTRIRLKKAKKNIDKCLDFFEQNLGGYVPELAIYNFAFNASNPALEAHTLRRVGAVRTWGKSYLNEVNANGLPSSDSPRVLGCTFHGPDNGDAFVDRTVRRFLQSDGGWLIINLHGLDGEGWGPLSSTFYDELVASLVLDDAVELLPVGMVLNRA